MFVEAPKINSKVQTIFYLFLSKLNFITSKNSFGTETMLWEALEYETERRSERDLCWRRENGQGMARLGATFDHSNLLSRYRIYKRQVQNLVYTTTSSQKLSQIK